MWEMRYEYNTKHDLIKQARSFSPSLVLSLRGVARLPAVGMERSTTTSRARGAQGTADSHRAGHPRPNMHQPQGWEDGTVQSVSEHRANYAGYEESECGGLRTRQWSACPLERWPGGKSARVSRF